MGQGKKGPTKREIRRVRTQQIIFALIAVIVILSWVISLVSN
ncbi:MAG TPA: hypothetical protein VIS10_14880 [Anaerolineales bacterium]